MAERLAMIMGSPRPEGVCARLCRRLVAALEEDSRVEKVDVLEIPLLDIHPCIGCDACRETFTCFFDDDMSEVDRVLGVADRIIIVSPVYFAGPPARLKALLDRMQPHYWMRRASCTRKRPAHLFVVGDGGDPHGYDPVVVCVKSAFAVAGFRLDSVHPCIGRSAEDDFSDLVSSFEIDLIAADVGEGFDA